MRKPNSHGPLHSPESYADWRARFAAGTLFPDDLSRWAWSAVRYMHARKASAVMTALIFVLSERADAGGHTCETLGDYARWVGASERAVSRCRQTLTAAGWLTRVTGADARKVLVADVYCEQGQVHGTQVWVAYQCTLPSPDAYEPTYPAVYCAEDLFYGLDRSDASPPVQVVW